MSEEAEAVGIRVGELALLAGGGVARDAESGVGTVGDVACDGDDCGDDDEREHDAQEAAER